MDAENQGDDEDAYKGRKRPLWVTILAWVIVAKALSWLGSNVIAVLVDIAVRP
jgi:hypothetical protein